MRGRGARAGCEEFSGQAGAHGTRNIGNGISRILHFGFRIHSLHIHMNTHERYGAGGKAGRREEKAGRQYGISHMPIHVHTTHDRQAGKARGIGRVERQGKGWQESEGITQH